MTELPEKVRISIVRFSYDGRERVEIGQWLVKTALALHQHPRVADFGWSCPIGYPITRMRNAALAGARRNGFHFVLMCDTDMIFDAHCADSGVSYLGLPTMPDQESFLPGALDFALEHPGPCVIAAPYCAGPPVSRVLVHRFADNDPSDASKPTKGMALECFTREEAARKTGYEMVAALPTGLMLIDTRVCEVMGPPWFRYEFKDDTETELASTEDVVFSRDLFYLGVPQYAAFKSWSAHIKDCVVGRPQNYPQNAYPRAVYAEWENEVLARAKNSRPADKVNAVAEQILKERAARVKSETDADPVIPEEQCDA